MVGRGHYQFVHAYDGIYIYIKKTNWCLLALHCAQPHKIHSQYKNYTTNRNITAHSIRLSEQVEAYCIHHILANDNSNECITTTKCTLNLKEADTANCIHTVHTRWIFNTRNFVVFFSEIHFELDLGLLFIHYGCWYIFEHRQKLFSKFFFFRMLFLN